MIFDFEERLRPEILQSIDDLIVSPKLQFAVLTEAFGKGKTQNFKTLQLPRQGDLMAVF